jgi:hypothetical protein
MKVFIDKEKHRRISDYSYYYFCMSYDDDYEIKRECICSVFYVLLYALLDAISI